MKKAILPCLLCVFLFILSTSVESVFAFEGEKIEFIHQNRIFYYKLEENIRTSNLFDLNFEINKYKRFASKEDRIHLLKKMLNSGFDKEIALNYLFPNLSNKINSISKSVNIRPQNAKLKINPNSTSVFQITKEIYGLEVDKHSLIESICDSYLKNQTLIFNIPTKTISPSIPSSTFSKFTHLRGDFSTDIYSSSPDRKHNIKNSLNSLNKIEILPNEIFSFNKTVGRRTASNGYREAKIIVNNEFVDGLGGGVCQVSSTLYNAALLSGLEIVEANKHSKQVGYVKHGFDAMVNFGSSDLKFRNNTNEKITIITNYSNSKARIRIYGEDMGAIKYKLKNEIINITNPSEKIMIDENLKFIDKVKYDDEFFYLQKASLGMEVKSYREKYVNDNLESTEVLRHDKFQVKDSIKVYGSIKRPNFS